MIGTRVVAAWVMVCLAVVMPVMGQNSGPAPARSVQPEQARPRPAEPARPPTEPGEQPVTPETSPHQHDTLKAMEAMEKAGRPGEHHRHLEAMAGRWNAAVRFRMDGDMPWMDSTGISVNRMDMGGRFLVCEYRGDMAGAEFTGIATWGYDNSAKEYQVTWRDSASTGLNWLHGDCEQSGRVFVLTGEYVDSVSGRRKANRQIVTIKDPDTYIADFIDDGPGGVTFKSMEIVYTRIRPVPEEEPPPRP